MEQPKGILKSEYQELLEKQARAVSQRVLLQDKVNKEFDEPNNESPQEANETPASSFFYEGPDLWIKNKEINFYY